jgi:Nucleotidyl transferase AbiEii toxin, Type IV TA system
VDVDLSLDAEALGDGEYATLVEALMKHGYGKREKSRRFQLVRTVPAADGGPPIDIVVDFLMPREVDIVKNTPPLVADFAAQKADGADLATHFYQFVAIDGSMPDGGPNRVEIAVCSIPALLAMKGHALNGRAKQKDPYDIYYSIRNFEGGPEVLADACRPLLEHESALRGYQSIAEKFDSPDAYGPDRVKRFVGANPVDGRTPEQWQQDAFGQVDAWLRALGLRK